MPKKAVSVVEPQVVGVVWKQYDLDNGRGSHYVLQLENIEQRELNRIKLDCCPKWNYTGWGTCKNGKLMLIYARDFVSLKELSEWTKQFGYPVSLLKPERASKIKQENEDGTEQVVKIVVKSKLVKLPGKKKEATKPIEPVKKNKLDRNVLFKKRNVAVKAVNSERKQYVCSVCGQLGHNSRTCSHKEKTF